MSLLLPWRRSDLAKQSSSNRGSQELDYTLIKKRSQEQKALEAQCRSRSSRSKSAPLADRLGLSHSEWDIHRPWSRAVSDPGTERLVTTQSISQLQSTLEDQIGPVESDHPTAHRDSPVEVGQAGILQKFRKTFSLRFNKRSSSSSLGTATLPSQDIDVPDDASSWKEVKESSQEMPPLSCTSSGQDTERHVDTVFKFGPLVWRSSRERKKGKKAIRNAKCNSGDSGIQLEMVGSSCDSENHYSQMDLMGKENMGPNHCCNSLGKKRPLSDLMSPTRLKTYKIGPHPPWAPGRPPLQRSLSDLGGSSGRGSLSQPSESESLNVTCHSASGTLRKSWRGTRVNALLSGESLSHAKRCTSQPTDLHQPAVSQTNTLRFETSTPRRSSADLPSDEDHGVASSVNSSEEDLAPSAPTSSHPSSQSTTLERRMRASSLDQALEEGSVMYAEALWHHVTLDPEELSFRVGDVIEVVDSQDSDWWWGIRGSRGGWFPASFVRLRVSQEETVEECLEAIKQNNVQTSIQRQRSISLLSTDQVRSNVIKEIVSTERDFVKNLQDVVEGFVRQAKCRTDMFSSEQILTIFGNVEQLHEFHKAFLAALESWVNWEQPHQSCIGDCFLKFRPGFEIYSEYCNNHPWAVSLLQELYEDPRYQHFFEACRLLRGMIEISLDGFLLTPVQKICKYPLQLAELLKYTKADHPDYQPVSAALESMRQVAARINERKRRVECLEKLAAWQIGVEGWEGDSLLCRSSQLIHQGEVSKVSSGKWTKELTLFLFDHQLVYCKKDLLKRHTYIYKGRINLDTSMVVDIPEAGHKPASSSTAGVVAGGVRHGWRVYSQERSKWMVFQCRSAAEKQRWMEALREERALVQRDREEGMAFSQTAKERAVSLALTHKGGKGKPRKPTGKQQKRSRPASPAPQKQLAVNRDIVIGSATLPAGMVGLPSPMKRGGSWIPFGGGRKALSRASIASSHSSVRLPVQQRAASLVLPYNPT